MDMPLSDPDNGAPLEPGRPVRSQAADVDLAYSAYDGRPLDEPDEWGNLGTFREAASRS